MAIPVQVVKQLIHLNYQLRRRAGTKEAIRKPLHGQKQNVGPGPRMVNQITAHHPGRYREEMASILPIQVL